MADDLPPTKEQGYVPSETLEGKTNQQALLPGLKQGHKLCGGCCDVRRATIIVNIVHLSLLGLQFMALLIVMFAMNGASNLDDDEIVQEIESMQASNTVPIIVVILVIPMIANVLGIWGAVGYKTWPVMISLAVYVVLALMSLVHFNVSSLALYVFFAYPHVYLIKEMKDGIMTEANYPNEKHSCCCV